MKLTGKLVVLSIVSLSLVLAYITTTNFLDDICRVQKSESSRREAPFSVDFQHCLCSSAFSKLFAADVVQTAIESRLNWTKSLPFTMEAEHLRHSNSSRSRPEQEYPPSNARFAMLGPIAPKCKIMESYGKGDGEKRACGLKGLLQKIKNCTIVSLGSKNQWGFEQDIFKAMPHCTIHTFDCTVTPNVKPPPEIASRTTLHRVCIGSADKRTGNFTFMSWKSVMRLIRASEPPLYLKMDIEGYEYQVLRSIIDDGFFMPAQIAFELHYTTSMKGLPWYGRRKSSGEIAAFMEYLHHQGGYFLLDRNDNVRCGSCTELLVSRLPCLACVTPTAGGAGPRSPYVAPP
jgi:hypothetical protein